MATRNDSTAGREAGAAAKRSGSGGGGVFQRPVSPRIACAVIGLVVLVVAGGLWWIEQAGHAPGPDHWAGNPKAWMFEQGHHITDSSRGSWGFNLTSSLAPRREILFSGLRKETVPALTEPDTVAAGRARWPRGGDPVVGVAIGGEARAYPLGVLRWHECVNDTLSGEPIAVTYSMFTRSIMVFSRRVEGEALEFGVSGLVYQSGFLLHDRRIDPHDESLWCPILVRAVCGPAAARKARLELLDCELATWRDWRAAHPATTVMTVNTSYSKRYGEPVEEEQDLGKIAPIYPVSRRTGRRPDLCNLDRLLILRVGDAERAYPMRDLRGAPGGVLRDRLGGVALTLWTEAHKPGVRVELAGDDRTMTAGLPLVRRAWVAWFAWDATHPDGEVHRPDPNAERRKGGE